MPPPGDDLLGKVSTLATIGSKTAAPSSRWRTPCASTRCVSRIADCETWASTEQAWLISFLLFRLNPDHRARDVIAFPLQKLKGQHSYLSTGLG